MDPISKTINGEEYRIHPLFKTLLFNKNGDYFTLKYFKVLRKVITLPSICTIYNLKNISAKIPSAAIAILLWPEYKDTLLKNCNEKYAYSLKNDFLNASIAYLNGKQPYPDFEKILISHKQKMDTNKKKNPFSSTKYMHPLRDCADKCGVKTHNYRCDSCWAKRLGVDDVPVFQNEYYDQTYSLSLSNSSRP